MPFSKKTCSKIINNLNNLDSAINIQNTNGVAIGNVFITENWFFNNNIAIKDKKWGPQKLTPPVINQVIQDGGGNPYQPASGVVIPGISEESKQLIKDKDNNVYLWNAEGGLINLLYEHKNENETIRLMKNYREKLVKENDIKKLFINNIKHVRISLGWWIFANEANNIYDYKIISDPYYDGSNEYRPLVRQLQGGLEWIENNLCKWLKKYNMEVIIDIHACPGGSSYGVSYAGIPSLWNENENTYKWLPGVFFISKSCQDKFNNTVVPNALEFIKRVNTKYSNLITAFEPMNEPGLGFYNITPPTGFDDFDEGLSSKNTLGTYQEIYKTYQNNFNQFNSYRLQYPNIFKNTQFWIQIFIAEGYAADGFNDPKDKAWTVVLNNLKPYLSTIGNDWPDWLALDYHWYQTWDIPICIKNCCDKKCQGTDCYNCSINSIASELPYPECNGGSFKCSTLCNNKNEAIKIFDNWIETKMVGDMNTIHDWFKMNFPKRLSIYPKTPLYKLLSCTEWSIATAPPREPYQQCNQKSLIKYFFKKQRDIYKKNGIINCYWTLKCPQGGNIKNGWSYQWLYDNNYISE